MTLQSSGILSMSQINSEFGRGTDLNAYRGTYFYYTDESQEGETVYGAFTTPATLEDNQRYLACVQTVNINIYLGHDNTNYT